MQDYSFAGKTVLVTGASMGLGEAFARRLHAEGATPVLVARSDARLTALANELGGAPYFVADLQQPGAAQRLFDAVTARGLTIDVLINNAGYASHGPFADVPLGVQRGQIDLNVTALVELTYAFLPTLERQRGGVINVASTAAFQPVPYMAVYAATKAFVLAFSEALWAEARVRGVRVLAACPGATDTPFFVRAGEAAAFGAKARPEDVVFQALEAFRAHRPSVVHGLGNYLTSLLARFFSRAFVVKVSAALMRPRAPRLPARQ